MAYYTKAEQIETAALGHLAFDQLLETTNYGVERIALEAYRLKTNLAEGIPTCTRKLAALLYRKNACCVSNTTTNTICEVDAFVVHG